MKLTPEQLAVPAHLRPRCWSKDPHASRGAAEAHIRSLRRFGQGDNQNLLTSYQCVTCGKWHVGRDKRKAPSQNADTP